MERTVRIATLDNEIHAQLVGGLLSERGIPHIIRSYHDTAYDGIFQMQQGWGCVEAPERYNTEIVGLLRSMDEL